MRIAVLDSGFLYTHSVFSTLNIVGQQGKASDDVARGWWRGTGVDFVDQDDEVMSADGERANHHGTASLSILAANSPGTHWGGVDDDDDDLLIDWLIYNIGKAVGGAYKAEFLLARTENIYVEERIEEDYFVAGIEVRVYYF